MDIELAAQLPFNCYGSEGCCHPGNLCDLNEGDCDDEDDCQGHGLTCGTNNCLSLGIANRNGGQWDSNDDCCERRCTLGHQCLQGDGDCDSDNDCDRPTWQTCESKGCLDRNFFPLATFPNNTADKYINIILKHVPAWQMHACFIGT